MDSLSNSSEPIASELVLEDESFEEIVTQFVEGLEERVKTMQDALNTTDYEALRVAAHQLKGSGGGYGYPALTHQAAELEKLATDRALDHCIAEFDKLKELCSRIVVNDKP